MKLGDTVTFRDEKKEKFVGVIVKTYGFTVTVRSETGEMKTVGRRAMKVIPKEEKSLTDES